jgi:hypothetical protein
MILRSNALSVKGNYLNKENKSTMHHYTPDPLANFAADYAQPVQF